MVLAMETVQRKVTYRLYPTSRQETALFEHLRLHQQLYNAALEQRINAWRVQRHSVTFAEQCRENAVLRRECPEYQAINSHSCQATLKRLDRAFAAFFRRVKTGRTPGFPRFKALARFKGWGYTAHGDGWRLELGKGGKHGRIRLMGIGTVKLRGMPRTTGMPKTCEIFHKNGCWYASVTVNCEPKRAQGVSAIGIDLGVESLATIAFEDGSSKTVENPRLIRRNLKRLGELQREVARKKRGSKNREKAKHRVAALHEKISNQRSNFLHQVTAALVAGVGAIATEQLNLIGMTRSARGTVEEPGQRVKQKAGLNREILSAAPGMFLQLLRYKAEEAGIEWTEVPTRTVKPSQTCAACGRQERKSLSQRVHRCACGYTAGRDENAARVMLNWALRASGRESTGCGGAAVAAPVKQETPPKAASAA